jgi:hypothetical protein
MANWDRFVRRGAVRVSVLGSNITTLAFRNLDGPVAV